MKLHRFLLVLAAAPLLAYGQDAPSLGDVARQARQHKQNAAVPSAKDAAAPQETPAGNTAAKDAPAKPAAKAAHVFTNEEIPEHPELSPSDSASDDRHTEARPSSYGGAMPPEQWKAQITAQKNAVSSLQGNIEKVNQSIQFAPGNCVSGCVQWNERQKQKQAEVERMKGQLQEQQKRLSDMQESARQQGYGSAVYDP